MKKSRITYAILFFLLLIIEVLIGLFINDNFIRPYVGDVLVTVLLCCLVRTIFPKDIPALSIYIFIFAVLVEFAQYIQIVKILGVENNPLLRTIIGTSFSPIDILCYGIGCAIFWLAEKTIRR